MAKLLNVAGPATAEDADKAYEATREPHDRERLIAIRMAQQGDYTLDQIGYSLKRGRATIARWLKAYREGGVEELLHRGHGGRSASLSKSDQDALMQGLRSGRWRTAREIQAWLQKEQGVSLSLSGIYYWVYRLKDKR
jgi:transposase